MNVSSARITRAGSLVIHLCLALATAAAATGATVYNIREFGAVGDGVAKDTLAFQKALDTCAINGGGDVLVPAGNYLIGSVQQGNRTTIRLAANSIIIGSGDAADYPSIDVRWEGRWQPGRRALIYASNVEHTGITGPGRIEGNAAMAQPQNPRGSLILEPVNCTDVNWDGFTLIQGGNWATHPTYCTDVSVQNVTIQGKRDGIDIDSCRGVRIEGCNIESGDDCISLKSGRGMDGARIGRPTEDVVIAHCTLKGVRFACVGIGSEISAGVRNIRIEHCAMTARTHAIYLKTRIGRAGLNEDISVEDIDVLGGGFLRLNLTVGGNTNTNDDAVPGLIGYPEAKNLRFENIRLHDATIIMQATEVALEKPIRNLTLAHISGTATKGITLQHGRSVNISDIHVAVKEGPLLSLADTTGQGLEGATQYIAPPTNPPK